MDAVGPQSSTRLFDYGRLSSLMERAGIDAIVASSKPNVGYLSGYWHNVWDDYYLMWEPSVSHKTLAVIPREESQGAFLATGAAELVPVERSNTWITDRRSWGPGFYIQSWKEPDPDPGNPMDVAAEGLAERGLAEGCIALELRYLGVSYYERLKALLPRAWFVDAEPVLWALRMVKTAEEIRRTRQACTRTARAWTKVIGQVTAGMTEKELQQAFRTGFAEEQVQFDGAYCLFGPAGVNLRQGPFGPSDNALREGQFIRTDIQGIYEGYYADLSRVVAFGRVRPEMERTHALVKDILEKLLGSLRPGVSCAEVRRIELELYKGTGYGAVVPFAGHSLGRMVHEPPYLSGKEPTVLEAGMVVTLEPTVCYSNGGDIFVCLEDEVLITEGGCENLTAEASQELYACR